MAAGSSAGSLHHVRPQRRATLVRLDHQRQPEPVDHASSTAWAPSSRNVACGSDIQSGVCRPARTSSPWPSACPRPAGRPAPACPRRGRRAARAPPASRRSRPRRRAARWSPRPAGRCAAARSARRRCPIAHRRRPVSRSASANRRPDRRDTSRSWDSPPASTTTCRSVIAAFYPRALTCSDAALDHSQLAIVAGSPAVRVCGPASAGRAGRAGRGAAGSGCRRCASRRARPPARRPAGARPR